MNTRKLKVMKIERIELNKEQLKAEQLAKQMSGNTHLSDEQFREIICRGLNLQGPENGEKE